MLPDVPTIAESGYPDYDVAVWWGIAAPHGVPNTNMTRLYTEITAVLDEPATHKRLLADAAVPIKKKPDDFRKMITAEIKKWRDVARAASIVVR